MKIGIDIGGSHIGLGLVDDKGKIIQKEEKFIKDKNDIENSIEEFIFEKVTEISCENFIENIGISIPGTIYQNKVLRSVNLNLSNYDLGENLAQKFNGKYIIKMQNDAKCATLAEIEYGNLSKYKSSIFLCIGTGVGGTVIVNKKILETDGMPGFEFSHTIIQKNGNLCNCGKRGCFETYASLKKFKEKISNEYRLNTMSGKIIREFIKNNPEDLRLRYMINNYIEDVSIGISNIINIFEPESICIGGSFAEYENIFFEPLKKSLLKGNLLFNKRDDIIIECAKLKNDAGIIGATLI